MRYRELITRLWSVTRLRLWPVTRLWLAASHRRRLVGPGALAAVCMFACSGDPDDSDNVIQPNYQPPKSDSVVREDAAIITDGGVESLFPAAYRFECIHIHKLGEPKTEGGPPPFQASFLNSLWSGDIAAHRLNILIGLKDLDPVAGTTQVFIGSGIGLDDPTQCQEPTTSGLEFPSQVTLDEARYVPTPPENLETCIAAAPAGTGVVGSVDVEVPTSGALYIYAQNETAVPFNCTPDQALPDAVPLRAVRASVTIDDSTNRLAGELTACLTQADIVTLCSCIRDCTATDPSDVIEGGDCDGCPRGGITLQAQLAGLVLSPDCASRTGGPGYELTASFHAVRLPHQPGVCGQ